MTVKSKIEKFESLIQGSPVPEITVQVSKNRKFRQLGGKKKKKSEIPNCIREILETAASWLDSSVFLSTPLCFIFLTLFFLGFGFNYFKMTSLAFILCCIGGAFLLAGISAVIPLVRYTLYLTFTDSGSKLLKILAVAFIMTTLTTGPLFRLWSTASTIPASVECTQEVTVAKVQEVLDNFKRALMDVSRALEWLRSLG